MISGVVGTAKGGYSKLKSIIDKIRGLGEKQTQEIPGQLPQNGTPSDGIGDAAMRTAQKTSKAAQIINSAFEGISNVITSVCEGVKGIITGLGEAISTAFQGIGQGIKSALEGVGTVIESLGTAISTVAQGIGQGLATAFTGLGTAIAMVPPTTWLALAAAILATGAAMALVGSQGEGLQMVLQGVADVVSAFGPVIKEVFEGISGVITSFGETVSGILNSVSGVIESIGQSALNAGKGFKELAKGIQIITGLNLFDMGASLAAVATGIGAISAASVGIGSAGTQMMALVTAIGMVGTTFASTSATVTNSCNNIISAMSAAEARASTSGTAMGTKFTSGLKGSLSKSVSIARSSCNNIISAFNACQSKAQYCGQMIGQGLANGLRASEGSVRAAAASLAAAADAAIQAKAKIGSPSKVTEKDGMWTGEGYVLGLESMYSAVKRASEKLLYLPLMSAPKMAFGGVVSDMNAEYDYTSNAQLTVETPLYINDREFARATYRANQNEINRNSKLNERLRGNR